MGFKVLRTVVTLFILLLPLLEIAGFVVVGSHIGALATVALVILSALVGAMLMRVQGFGALRRAQVAAETGGAPDREIVHGAMILVAGILLMIPGFITDILGLALFIPPVRDVAWKALRSRIVVMSAGPAGPRRRPGADPRVVDLDEADYHDIDPSSPWRRPSLPDRD